MVDGAGDHPGGGVEGEAERQAGGTVGQGVGIETTILERGRGHVGHRCAVNCDLIRQGGNHDRCRIGDCVLHRFGNGGTLVVGRRDNDAIDAAGNLAGGMINIAGDHARRGIDAQADGQSGGTVGQRVAGVGIEKRCCCCQ